MPRHKTNQLELHMHSRARYILGDLYRGVLLVQNRLDLSYNASGNCQVTSGGQPRKVAVFGCEGHGFESYRRRSGSLLGSPLLAAAPFRKMFYTVISLM